jgi:hypothetical protein
MAPRSLNCKVRLPPSHRIMRPRKCMRSRLSSIRSLGNHIKSGAVGSALSFHALHWRWTWPKTTPSSRDIRRDEKGGGKDWQCCRRDSRGAARGKLYERIVPIPQIDTYSELPFALVEKKGNSHSREATPATSDRKSPKRIKSASSRPKRAAKLKTAVKRKAVK